MHNCEQLRSKHLTKTVHKSVDIEIFLIEDSAATLCLFKTAVPSWVVSFGGLACISVPDRNPRTECPSTDLQDPTVLPPTPTSHVPQNGICCKYSYIV
jgi:hypothetical protein